MMTRLRSPPRSATYAQGTRLGSRAPRTSNEQARADIMSAVNVTDTNDPATWTSEWINGLNRNTIRPILRGANVQPRPPFEGDYDNARVADLRNAMQIHAGLQAEFRMGDTVALDNGEALHPACTVVGIKDSLPGRPKVYDIRVDDELTAPSRHNGGRGRAIKVGVLGAHLSHVPAVDDMLNQASMGTTFYGITYGAGAAARGRVDDVTDEAGLESVESAIDAIEATSTRPHPDSADEPPAQRVRTMAKKIVLTGGPCGLKSTTLSVLTEELPRYGVKVLPVEEVATSFMAALPANFDPSALSPVEQVPAGIVRRTACGGAARRRPVVLLVTGHCRPDHGSWPL
jgi:hypothetical protein